MDTIEVVVTDNDDRQTQSDGNLEEEKRLNELFRVLRPLCRDYLRASHLIIHLPFIGAHAKKITKAERKSSPDAINMLFDLIKDCEEPEKWKKFTLALKEADFLSLYKVCNVCEKNDFDSYIEIFDVLSVDFAENDVDIVNLSQGMLQLESFTEKQFEQINLVFDEEGKVAAMLEFMSCLTSPPEKWIKDLSSIIKKPGLQKLIQKKGSEISCNESNIETLVECWKFLIISRVCVNDIWLHLKSGLDLPEPTSDLSDQDKMEKILRDIKDCQNPGKWRTFCNALQAAGFESLCKKLDGDIDVKDDESYLKLITICAPEIRRYIVVSELLCQLESKGVIGQQNSQEIQKCRDKRGDIAAAELLLDSIHRKKEKWFSIFLQCLIDNGQSEIAKQIDPDFKGLLQIEHSENEDLSLNSKSGKNNEECEDFDVEEEEEELGQKQLNLRDYQEELLEEPRKEKNCIICAPTGSGKTIVALKLIEEHLSQNDGKIHKVIFLANQVALVQQQGKQCKQYLSQYNTNIVTGNNINDNRTPIETIFQENDIIVLTPQILLDNLSKGYFPSKSLSLFTLMIFDECHHTTKKHPYNELMAKYIDEKLENNNCHLPQIIGLTASIGVGGAKTEEQAVDHIQSVCANLDCEEICTVKRHLQELNAYLNTPIGEIKIVPGLSDDPFKDGMNELMKQVEDRFMDPEVSTVVQRENPTLFAMLSEHTHKREANHYTNWLGDIKKYIILLENVHAHWHCLDCWQILEIYHNALIINDSCRIKDAIVFIKARLAGCGESATLKSLLKLWEQKKEYFEELSQDTRYFNPLLRKLEEIVVSTIKEIPESRIFIFVKTRSLVSALTDWIQESEQLKILNPKQLVGGSKRADNTGMTTQQQEQKLGEFKLGNCKLLVATLGEEGLDIQKCNLVMNFNDVKNEISMVQKRGRARAKNSQYITLANASSGISERELGNISREKMMCDALKVVQRLMNEDPAGYSENKEDRQKNDMSLRELNLRYYAGILKPGEYELRCIKCSVFFFLSSELRVIHKTQYTVLNELFESKISVKKHPKPKSYDKMTKVSKIFCSKCQTDLGIKIIYRKHLFPIIKISSFIIWDSKDERSYVKQWKDVPFQLQAISSEELIQFPFSEITAE